MSHQTWDNNFWFNHGYGLCICYPPQTLPLHGIYCVRLVWFYNRIATLNAITCMESRKTSLYLRSTHQNQICTSNCFGVIDQSISPCGRKGVVISYTAVIHQESLRSYILMFNDNNTSSWLIWNTRKTTEALG